MQIAFANMQTKGNCVNYTVTVFDNKKNKTHIHIEIPRNEIALCKKANRILVIDNRISFQGHFNDDGFIVCDMLNVDQTYLENFNVDIEGRESCYGYNVENGVVKIELETMNFKNTYKTFVINAVTKTKCNLDKVITALNKQSSTIDYRATMVQNKLYLTAIN